MYKSILVIVLFISTNLYAIVDIERVRYKSKGKNHYLAVKGSVGGKQGSSDKQEYSAESYYKFVRQQYELFLHGSYEYSKGNRTLISKDRLIHLRYTYHFASAHAFESYYQYANAPFSTIFFRALEGANYRYSYSSKIHMGIGLFNETQESFYAKRDLVRINSYISFFYKLSSSANLTLSAYLQPALKELTDINGTLKSELESKITKSLSIIYSIQMDRISKQSAGEIKNDLSYAASFSYHWE